MGDMSWANYADLGRFEKEREVDDGGERGGGREGEKDGEGGG